MKKNEIFTFTAPSGVEVTAVVVKVVEAIIPSKIDSCWSEGAMMYICYAQNRLFTMTAKIVGTPEYHVEVIVDHATLPDYDKLLEDYSDYLVTQAESQDGM